MATKRNSSQRALWQHESAPAVRRGVENGPAIEIHAHHVQASGDRWFGAFLDANRSNLDQLSLRPEIHAGLTTTLRLHPSEHIGAVPLFSPSTRRVVAGLVVSARLGWHSLGSVLGGIGFQVEPRIQGDVLVPGSAREVPVWLLAAPVIRAIEDYILHRKQGFIEKRELKSSPRGRIDWAAWARKQVPKGQWDSFPCRYYETGDDPTFLSAIRWTLRTIDHQLQRYDAAPPARLLRQRITLLQPLIGAGAAIRPHAELRASDSEWIASAARAMQWVADERGLGGLQRLDGISWSLSIHEVWEAWVDELMKSLAPSLGLQHVPRKQTQRGIHWETPLRSMTKLVPDSALTGADRMVWIDAKYKPHLHHLARTGWHGLSDDMQAAHRADLHQALAYSALSEDAVVDSLLVYPLLGRETAPPHATATLTRGRRLLRLHLIGVPFGFSSEHAREQTRLRLQEALRMER